MIGQMQRSITVVGSGVIGLTTAIRLAAAGHRVRIQSAAQPAETTSAVAAAIWYPYRAYPERDVTRWSATTYEHLTDLSGTSGAGVAMRHGREIYRHATPDPWWKDAVPSLRRATDLPPGYADGFTMTVPVIDMSVHLDWLVSEATTAGIEISYGRIDDLDTVSGDVVVNCSGLGAAGLAADATMTPIRGQVVVVEQFGLTEWTLDETDDVNLTYIVPRETTVVLGGTAIDGATDTTPDPAIAAAIVERCAVLVPEVASARVVAHKVGLRPGRPAVRLEAAVLPSGRPVVHCYGHGGAGVTLAFGCAVDVAELVMRTA
jgi:D-amino-acid oxidase